MPALILPLVDAATHWPERGGLIGLDLGTKTIGVAVSCALGSAYGFLQGAWPFGLVEAIWACVALRRWWIRPR